MKDTCDFPFFGEIIGFGEEHTIFPGQKENELDASIWRVGEELKPGCKVPSTGEAEGLIAIICISYSSLADDHLHHTGRNYRISKKNGAPIKLEGETIPLDQLKFVPNHVHSSFAD